MINRPINGDPKFPTWNREDSMNIAWLWNSMIPEISGTCIKYEMQQSTYSKAKEVVQVYEVKVKTVVAKQGNKIVIESVNQLKYSQR